MDILNQIRLEDLRGEQKELAELIGLEPYLKLVKTCGGSDLYIAKADKLCNIFRDQEIIEKFDGTNHARLAAEYGLCERTIREIVSEAAKELKRKPLDGQLTLF